jgi:hypothetical protein
MIRASEPQETSKKSHKAVSVQKGGAYKDVEEDEMARHHGSPGIKKSTTVLVAVVVSVGVLIFQNFHHFDLFEREATTGKVETHPKNPAVVAAVAANQTATKSENFHSGLSSINNTKFQRHPSSSATKVDNNETESHNTTLNGAVLPRHTTKSLLETVSVSSRLQSTAVNESFLFKKDHPGLEKRYNDVGKITTTTTTTARTFKIAHVINPYAVSRTATSRHNNANNNNDNNSHVNTTNGTTFVVGQHDNPYYPLDQAQNITISSMLRARNYYTIVTTTTTTTTAHRWNITFYATIFPEEAILLQPSMAGFEILFLNRSTMTEYPHLVPPKKLPFVNDIFQLVYHNNNNTDFDYLIYTNTDIGLHESFYSIVAEIIEFKNWTAFTINRRSISNWNPTADGDGVLWTANDLEAIYNAMVSDGAFHPGFDCFVIQKNLIPRLSLGNLFLGFPPWGRAFDHILKNFLFHEKKYFNYNSDLNATFHLGHDLKWLEENNDDSNNESSVVVVDQRLKKQISTCPPIKWKLRRIKRMTPYRLQNTLNCAALFGTDNKGIETRRHV